MRIRSSQVKEGLCKIVNAAKTEARQQAYSELMDTVEQHERSGRRTMSKQEVRDLIAKVFS